MISKLLVTLLLFCNVLSIGYLLVDHCADWINYVNLAGCVMFGMYLDYLLQNR